MVTNANTGVSQSALTADSGYYRFPLLPAGTYDLQVSASGFAILQQRGVGVGVGSGVHLPLKM